MLDQVLQHFNLKWRNKWYYENSKSLEESGLLIKDVSKTIKNEVK